MNSTVDGPSNERWDSESSAINEQLTIACQSAYNGHNFQGGDRRGEVVQGDTTA